MTNDISDLLEQRGWHYSATLQRFKTFNFEDESDVTGFALRLFNLDFSKQIHMQVTPKKTEQAVEVYLSHGRSYDNEVKDLLIAIEDVYNDVTTPDS